MRRSFFLIFINAVILLMVFALLAQSIFIIKRLAKAEFVKGRVVVQPNGRGAFIPLSQDDFIKTNDVIRTGSDGIAEFKWADGTRLKVEPSSHLTVKKATYNMARKADESQFRLAQGTIFVRIVKALSPQSRFEVETPTAVAAVRGTIFMVKVDGTKTRVAVHKGAVNVKSQTEENVRESIVTPGKVAISQQQGQIEVNNDAGIEREFAARESIIKPELTARLTHNADSNGAIIQGRTEAGDKLTINGKKVNVLGNGVFRYRVTLQRGPNHFAIVSTDKHGATKQITRSITLP
jgi:hypothetical protein